MVKVEFPNAECISKLSHHYILVAREVWWCKNCWKSKWLPEYSETAATFSMDIARSGIDEAYAKWLQDRPETAKMLRRLEEVRLLRIAMPNKEEMLRDIIKYIVMPKDKANGRRRVAIEELEMLILLEPIIIKRNKGER